MLYGHSNPSIQRTYCEQCVVAATHCAQAPAVILCRFDVLGSSKFLLRLSGQIRRPILTQVALLAAFCIFWIFLAWAASHICISVFPVSISTRITRPASKDVCLQRDPCHVYLTVGRDLAHELILHVHSNHKYGNLVVAMSTQSHSDARCTNLSLPLCCLRLPDSLLVMHVSCK